jgi:hypothetical protein
MNREQGETLADATGLAAWKNADVISGLFQWLSLQLP